MMGKTQPLRLWLLLAVLGLPFLTGSLLAQEATLRGRIDHANKNDELQFYVTGTVDVKRLDIDKDGTFSVNVDLFEPTRCILFWKGRAAEDWSFALWLQPDSTSTVSLGIAKGRKHLTPTISFQGARASLSRYTNAYYQAFEQQNLFDEAHLSPLPDFSACQHYVNSILQPLGEALLAIGGNDNDNDNDDDDENHDDDDDGNDDKTENSFCAIEREELDHREAEAEFAFAVIAEQRGQHMNQDAAFRTRLQDIDPTDADQAYCIALMTAWDVAARPQYFAPLTDEAARLRSLAAFTTDEDVRNAAADHIMRSFFLRVQMGEVDPSAPTFRALYEELRNVSTDGTYSEFIDTRLQMMDHPELYNDNDDDNNDDDNDDDDDDNDGGNGDGNDEDEEA